MRRLLIKISLSLSLSLYGLFAFSQEEMKTIEIKVLPGLQFDIVRFQVKPGTKVKIVFKNTDEMDHNLIVTKPNSREEVVMAALQMGGEGPMKNYIPEMAQVLWSIPIVSADQTKSITFTAPNEEGIYPYVCTYPGHGFVMFGAMYISSIGEMPKLSEDLNIPLSRRDDNESKHHKESLKQKENHKHSQLSSPVPPYLNRVYIEGASPAAIAVRLSDSLSYCWDAGLSKLRFAWSGGFLDNTLLWKGHKDATSTIIGTIFYRDKVAYPLRINNKKPKVDYKGYRLIDRFPEFHYTVDGLDVYELIKPLASGKGFLRSFKIPKINNSLSFLFDESDGISYQSDVGDLMNGEIIFPSHKAKSFSIIMTEKKGALL